MISIESLSSQWIDRVAAVYVYRDKALLEKASGRCFLWNLWSEKAVL